MKKDVNGKELSFEVTTDMPWQGTTVYSCTNEQSVHGSLAIRIPEWSRGFKVSGVTGELDENSAQLRDGYLYITHDWKKGIQSGLNSRWSRNLLLPTMRCARI